MHEPEQQPVATVRICPRCGAEFAPGAGLKNLCPRCLMQGILEDSAQRSGGGPPSAPSAASQPPARDTGFRFKPGDRVLDGYTIVAPVGHGGFGEVYHARSDAGKEVALKLVQRFLEVELRGVGHCLNLKHPNLVTIYDVRPDSDGQHWIVMEYVAGENLAQAIDAHPQGLPIEEAIRWLEGIAAAVEHLHEAGIVHRDLKPSNIFQDRATIKVGDYGLSKFITASRRSGQTQSIGTLHYMAPEIGGGRYGREVDVYAVGVILYEMLTGEVPFDGQTPAEILMKHLTAPPDLSKLPPPLRGTVGRMLAKRPEERYGSLQAVLADLRARLTDAASDELEGGRGLPFYSSPGLSTWLEAPFATLEQQLAKAQSDPLASDAGNSRPAQSSWLRTAIRERPWESSLCLFLTLAVLSFPIGLAAQAFQPSEWPRYDPPWGIMAALLWIFFDAALSLAFGAWAFLLRRKTGMPLHGSSPPSSGLPGISGTSYAQRRVTPTPATGSGGDGDESAVETPPLPRAHAEVFPAHEPEREPRPSGTWLNVFGVLLIALFWGVGAGLLVAGISLSVWRDEEIAVLLSFGTGFFIAGLIAIRCLFSLGFSPFLRLMAAAFCGAAVGLAVGALQLVQHPHGDELAVLMGMGAGFFAAGMIALRFLSVQRWTTWRALAGLMTGAGAGLLGAGLFLMTNSRADEEAALFGFGVGFLAAGTIWFRLSSRCAGRPFLKILTALLTGAGVALLTGLWAVLIVRDEEIAVCLAAGTGLLSCGVVAYRLFVRVPAGPARTLPLSGA